MMRELSDGIENALRRYKDEVLRWNARFNLISRIDAAGRLEELVEESVAAHSTLNGIVWPTVASSFTGPAAALHYLDLGSGSGIPGLVWHLLSDELGLGGRDLLGSLMVEPRKKRAWFIERSIEIMDLHRIRVGEDQWGARTILQDEMLPANLTGLITLKALRLTDDEVIAGWRRYRRPAGVAGDALVICRFHNRSVNLDDGLRRKLHLPADGVGGESGASWARLFPVGDETRSWSLLVSVYPCF